MGASERRRGIRFEYTVRDALKKVGYFVMRSPGSRGPIDLIAYDDGECLFVQCKLDGALSPAEWNGLFGMGALYKAHPILARRPPGKKRGVEFFRLLKRKDTSKRTRNATVWRRFEP